MMNNWNKKQILKKIERNGFIGIIVNGIKRRKIDALDVKNILYFYVRDHTQENWTPIDIKNIVRDIVSKKVSNWRKKFRCEVCQKHYKEMNANLDGFKSLTTSEEFYMTSPDCKKKCITSKSVRELTEKKSKILSHLEKKSTRLFYNKEYEINKKEALEVVKETLDKLILDKKDCEIFYQSVFLGESAVNLGEDYNISRKAVAKIIKKYMYTIAEMKKLKMEMRY